MLFNSIEFLFFFLPIVCLVYAFLGAGGRQRAAVGWLVGASLVFYGWWSPKYVALIVCSVLFNRAFSLALDRVGGRLRRPVLVAGVAANLGLLGYFKYANFFVENLNSVTGLSFSIGQIALPLGISFFTFQQIAFLVDVYRGKAREYDFLHYCLFVTFFPQLIAGPIVHHGEMLPQFMRSETFRMRWENLAVGLSMLILGLFKKVVIADGMAQYANPVFDMAEAGGAIGLFEAWRGAVAYSFQIYFDFSGYSEMAMGLARLFGIRLPLNFYSPYRSTSIIEFWRRWHMTLSRFLRDYLYFPLGGNRRGRGRRYANLMVTMLLGGLWHGAGWTFVAWGALHGVYLVINHAWRSLGRVFPGSGAAWLDPIYRCLTYISVVVAWVLFRADSLTAATAIFRGMSGVNGVAAPFDLARFGASGTRAALSALAPARGPLDDLGGTLAIVAVLLLVWFMPNVPQLMRRFDPAVGWDPSKQIFTGARRMTWLPNFAWCTALVAVLAVAFYQMLVSGYEEFIYWSF
jgi:D-alanyl-lipoteichoic acid acyltransferase DltB (MBOAT superfamily)